VSRLRPVARSSSLCHPPLVDITDDVERGAWLAQRMEHGTGSVSDVAGAGFDAYVRVLHPLPDDERFREPTLDGSWSTRRWATVAEQEGRVMHPLVQWGRLLGIDDPSQDTTSDVGWLDPGLIAALAPILGDATTTPGDLVAGFWEGVHGQELTRQRVMDGRGPTTWTAGCMRRTSAWASSRSRRPPAGTTSRSTDGAVSVGRASLAHRA
jgi:hypothetical protein